VTFATLLRIDVQCVDLALPRRCPVVRDDLAKVVAHLRQKTFEFGVVFRIKACVEVLCRQTVFYTYVVQRFYEVRNRVFDVERARLSRPHQVEWCDEGFAFVLGKGEKRR